ncbi:MAG: carboxypeptidase regulatory-like domain-containing protein [Jatrophihabitantaceae bacterium]
MTPPSRPGLDQLALGEIDAIDVRVLNRMRGVYDTLDPVPSGLVERVQFGITLDALHAEVAELQRADDLLGVRSELGEQTQTVTFTSSAFTTMITITAMSADRVRIDGWIAPAGRMHVELRTQTGSHTVESDEDGRFALDEAPRGLAKLVLSRLGDDAQPVVVTPTIEL